MKHGWPCWNLNGPRTSPAEAAFFQRQFNAPDFNAALFSQHINREIAGRYAATLQGLDLYQHHPYRRTVPKPNTLWQAGHTRLLEYGIAGAPPVLLIPSLINRADILDLNEHTSFARWLAARGFHVLMVDWDTPDGAEQNFTLDDYITQRLIPITQFIYAHTKQPVSLLGYCMGGIFATALAQLQPAPIRSLLLLATPWDFHAGHKPTPLSWWQNQADAIDKDGIMNVERIQSLFMMIDPLSVAKKFQKFADYDLASDKARHFVALEDWLNDGVPMARHVARECLVNWYGHNTPATGQFTVLNTRINPAQLRLPCLAIIPQHDRIVPPQSAMALASLIPGALSLTPPLGHIGMMASRDAETLVWEPLAAWLGAQ